MMQQIAAAADAAWRVLLTCLVLGAGLPTLYTVGLKQLSLADGTDHPATSSGVRTAHRVLAIALFAVVIVAVLLGLSFIVAHGLGYSIKFDGVMPIITKK